MTIATAGRSISYSGVTVLLGMLLLTLLFNLMVVRSLSLAVSHCGAHDIRYIHKERFVRLDIRVAVNRDAERVRRQSRGNDLIRQALCDVIAVGSCRRIVLCGDVKTHIRSLRRRGQTDCECRSRRSAISFRHCHVIDREIRRRASRTVVCRTRVSRRRR